MEELCLMWTVELSRIRYYLRDYLRVRLGKVEKFAMSLLDNPGVVRGWWVGGWCVGVCVKARSSRSACCLEAAWWWWVQAVAVLRFQTDGGSAAQDGRQHKQRAAGERK